MLCYIVVLLPVLNGRMWYIGACYSGLFYLHRDNYTPLWTSKIIKYRFVVIDWCLEKSIEEVIIAKYLRCLISKKRVVNLRVLYDVNFARRMHSFAKSILYLANTWKKCFVSWLPYTIVRKWNLSILNNEIREKIC